MKKISIDPISRLEGHGKIEIFLDEEGNVKETFFQVPELRGFEQFAVGRPIEEMPQITSRICGVCPEAHMMAAAKAGDAVYKAEVPSAGKKLRELVYSAFYVQDHATHFYALGGPDFVVGPDAPKSERNIIGVIKKVGLEIGGKVIKARKLGHRVTQIFGGRTTHPVSAVPGGMTKPIVNDEEYEELKAIGDYFLEFGKFTIQIFEDVVLKNKTYVDLILSDIYVHKTHNMGLVDKNNCVNFYDGKIRVTDVKGKEIAKFEAKDYLKYISEHTEKFSYLKFPYLKAKGWKGFVDGEESGIYKATPLSRLNVSDKMATPLAQAEFEKFYNTLGGKPVHHTLATHWARVIELLYAAERYNELIKDEEIRSDKVRVALTEKPTEGVGVVEAPRGTLYHHYITDEKGIVKKANLIVGTTNNNAPITLSIKRAAEKLITKGKIVSDGILNMIEMAFRAYDPCFSCATHSLPGQMPMEVVIYDNELKEMERVRRP
ncbi:MAG TPA: Ni/Fe hydrogenase subunit alpha [bacterium]|nr:Ni/Fe hydrogenase subunit alpha [bacterium]HOL47201.1 Ni/Fe hydrogenase subunit alpha [bacterium]HPQ17694.1 Ni/Fe hydrogenase subunit alpha [bacterium]